tara:strand:+ start:575 stop:1042 length:468 start_codon:yes stop_codon:yes gene_type:complete
MASQLRVDKIVPVDGVPTGGGGGIIQIVQTVKQDQFTTSSTSYVDVTGMSATITPKFSTSKILVMLMTTVQQNGSRTRFDIHNSTSGGRISGSTNGMQGAEGTSVNLPCHMSFLHSPATTSATTYKLQMLNTGGSTSYFNASTHTGTMTLMEVSA